MTAQDDIRCPHCSALLRAGAQWCTLCYADLRPKVEPMAARVREPSYVGAGALADPPTAPRSPVEAAVRSLQQKTLAEDDPSNTPVGWPCTGCEATVSFADDVCPSCGTRFLEGARGEPDLLDRIGRGGLPLSTQSLIIAGGAAAMIAIIVTAMYLIGLIF